MVMTTTQKTEQALIDSGATENFIDPQTVERLRLPIRKLLHPHIIYNIDRTFNKAGSITHRCSLCLQFETATKVVDFFITDLGHDRVILGYPFLQEFNPNINWEKRSISDRNKVFITPQYLWEHRWKVWKQDGCLLRKADLLRKTSFAQQWAAAADKVKERLKETRVPRHYLHHRKVFSEEEAKRLPPN